MTVPALRVVGRSAGRTVTIHITGPARRQCLFPQCLDAGELVVYLRAGSLDHSSRRPPFKCPYDYDLLVSICEVQPRSMESFAGH